MGGEQTEPIDFSYLCPDDFVLGENTCIKMKYNETLPEGKKLMTWLDVKSTSNKCEKELLGWDDAVLQDGRYTGS